MTAPGVEAGLWRAFAHVLEYPTERATAAAWECVTLLEPLSPGASAAMAGFAAFAQEARRGELEEAYTRTFDFEPSRSPYVGFHLFGESYKRSVFLLRVKAEARAHGLDLGGELADHLTVLLRLLAASADADFKAELAGEALLPALRRMLGSGPSDSARAAAADPPTAYRAVLDALGAALERCYPTPLGERDSPAGEPSSQPAR